MAQVELQAPIEPPDASNEYGPQPKVSHSGGATLGFSLEPLQHDASTFDPSQLRVEEVEHVDDVFGRFGGRCLVLRGALTPEECRYLIEEMGSWGQLEQVAYRHDYRSNDRCIFESPALADVLWDRVRPVAEAPAVSADDGGAQQRLLAQADAEGECPEELRLPYGCAGTWRPFGLNECLRFCRYKAGGFFRAHCDATFRRSDDEMSLFTCMFYLDGGFGGGETRFLKIHGTLNDKNYLKPASDDQVLASVVPEPGMCLLFFQPGLLHEGGDLLDGCKHILRTDVMFRRDAGSAPVRTPEQVEGWRLVQEAQEAEASGECERAVKLYKKAFKLDPALERML